MITDRSKGWRQKRTELIEQLRAILDAAGTRNLTDAQARDYDAAYAEAERLALLIDAEEGTAGEPGSHTRAVASRALPTDDTGRRQAFADASRSVTSRTGPTVPPDPGPGSRGVGNPELREQYRRGRPVELRADERLADVLVAGTEHDIAAREVGFGRWVRGIALGDWDGVSLEHRQILGAIDTAGGYLVPMALSAQLIDRARAQAVLLRAGAGTIPMPTAEFDVARVAGDVTTEWVTESQTLTPTDMTFERVSLKAKALVASAKVSWELLQDATNIDDAVETSMGQAIALKLDEVGLRGDGAGKPTGIRNQVGVQVVSSVGSPTDYVKVAIDPVRLLADVNAEGPFASISAPRLYHSLAKLVTGITGDKTPLPPPQDWIDLRKFSTTQVPTNLGGGANGSEQYVGDFRQLVFGIRSELRIEVFREIYADQRLVFLVAHMRGDLFLRHPDHFVVNTDILA